MDSAVDCEKDLEGGMDIGGQDTPVESSYHSDTEKAEYNTIDQGAIGIPDLAHDAVEQMDAGHVDDLARTHASSLLFSCLTMFTDFPRRQRR